MAQSHKPIVVIEDDRTIRENLQELLESEGYLVSTAATGREGLERIEELKGACTVLLDLQMPIMSGEQMLDAIESHSHEEIRNTPIVVITARTEGISRKNVVKILKKPLDLDLLLETLAMLDRT